jgi:hypothetical protein
MAFVPEGRCDRSLARSAWDSAAQKSRPVGHGLIRAGVCNDSIWSDKIGQLSLKKHGAHLEEK